MHLQFIVHRKQYKSVRENHQTLVFFLSNGFNSCRDLGSG